MSKSADSLKSFAVTVAIGRSGIVIAKQLDNTAQKLITAAGKRFELLPFFLGNPGHIPYSFSGHP